MANVTQIELTVVAVNNHRLSSSHVKLFDITRMTDVSADMNPYNTFNGSASGIATYPGTPTGAQFMYQEGFQNVKQVKYHVSESLATVFGKMS